MIRLFDGWAIDADSYQYILGKPTPNEVNGKRFVTMEQATYYATVGKALTALYNRMMRESIKDCDHDLSSAIRVAKTIEERINAAMREPEFEEASNDSQND